MTKLSLLTQNSYNNNDNDTARKCTNCCLCCNCARKEPAMATGPETRTSESAESAPKDKRHSCKFLGSFLVALHLLVTVGFFLSFECWQFYLLKTSSFPHLIIPSLATLLFLICLVLMIFTVAIDPGVYPRLTPELQELEASYYNKTRLEPDFDLEVGVRRQIYLYGRIVEADYCFECRHFKDLRTRHCRICNRCIVRHDHHCVVLGCCVGIRNFALFFYFLIFLLIFYCFVFGASLSILVSSLMVKGIKTAFLGAPSGWIITLTFIALITFGMGHILLFPFSYCCLIAQDRTARELFFVIETHCCHCRCTTVDKDPRKKRPKTGCKFVAKNFRKYLCVIPPKSLKNRRVPLPVIER